jgi:hypothetical protein
VLCQPPTGVAHGGEPAATAAVAAAGIRVEDQVFQVDDQVFEDLPERGGEGEAVRGL